jgi:hypothetical protein
MILKRIKLMIALYGKLITDLQILGPDLISGTCKGSYLEKWVFANVIKLRT